VSKRLVDDDRSLLERIEHGDHQAMALLYDRHGRIVYSVALRVLIEPALAEKVLSDIFIDIWHCPERFFAIRGSLSLALAMTARNRAVASLLQDASTGLEPACGQWTDEAADQTMTRAEASAVIERLPAERRVILERAFLHGMTRAEFALPSKTLSAMRQPGVAQLQPAASEAVAQLAGSGIEVIDVEADAAFARRGLHARDAVAHMEGMNRLAHVFQEDAGDILQELVAAAVDLCGADSAGISIELKDGTDENFYHWAATAGQYSGFADARLPRFPSACGVTLERNRPQIFRVSQRFFDLMGIVAPTVTDGLLLPWQAGETRGTIWIMAHGRDEAFDSEDCRMMQALAKFAATGVRLQQQQTLRVEKARTEAGTAVANELAAQIKEPLQNLMQTAFLFGREDAEPAVFAQQAMGDISRLSEVVSRLLPSTELSARAGVEAA
jgi:DNA-directed RNA polymerase specialized sigma24 family protein